MRERRDLDGFDIELEKCFPNFGPISYFSVLRTDGGGSFRKIYDFAIK